MVIHRKGITSLCVTKASECSDCSDIMSRQYSGVPRSGGTKNTSSSSPCKQCDTVSFQKKLHSLIWDNFFATGPIVLRFGYVRGTIPSGLRIICKLLRLACVRERRSEPWGASKKSHCVSEHSGNVTLILASLVNSLLLQHSQHA